MRIIIKGSPVRNVPAYKNTIYEVLEVHTCEESHCMDGCSRDKITALRSNGSQFKVCPHYYIIIDKEIYDN